jgi:hypothetical protein
VLNSFLTSGFSDSSLIAGNGHHNKFRWHHHLIIAPFWLFLNQPDNNAAILLAFTHGKTDSSLEIASFAFRSYGKTG